MTIGGTLEKNRIVVFFYFVRGGFANGCCQPIISLCRRIANDLFRMLYFSIALYFSILKNITNFIKIMTFKSRTVPFSFNVRKHLSIHKLNNQRRKQIIYLREIPCRTLICFGLISVNLLETFSVMLSAFHRHFQKSKLKVKGI